MQHSKSFKSTDFERLNEKQKGEKINRTLVDLIRRMPRPSFLLSAVIDYIDRVQKEKLLDHYSFSIFELWLNQFSELSAEENYTIRALIAGKCIPREEYQLLFPIGMGKVHPGSHFVTAHSSPDLDTTIASFWGWVDAFAARVADGLHIWNVPGGAPPASIEIALLFYHIFGTNVFHHLSKTRTSLAISSVDIMTQKGLVKQQPNQSMQQIDHERMQKAIILVDDSGFYLGDWRHFDVEGVRQVIMLLYNCLRWFENHFHVQLVLLFSKERVSLTDCASFLRSSFGIKMKDCQPVKEFTDKQKKQLQLFLEKILKVPKGLDSTFEEFSIQVEKLGVYEFKVCLDLIESLDQSNLFDHSGYLIENRPKIFHYLQKIITSLDQSIQSIRSFTERLEIGLEIKTQVFGFSPQFLSYRADVEEMRSKMATYPYLTVTSTDREGRLMPLGIVQASDIHKPILGTVTLRDFCNREETKIPSYLEIISVIDHHKSQLATFSAPVVHISDSQSSNAIVADLAFQINDSYSTQGMTTEQIEEQIGELQKDLSSSSSKRLLNRLLQRYLAAALQTKYPQFFIDPMREFVEYLHFLYGILDDTDLLTKVSRRDVECVASLLNRLKSLMVGKEVEIITFDDIVRDENFVEAAASRVLQNVDMYSLYRKIYLAKEQLVEENLAICAKGQPSTIFEDTKEQNSCCRVGQTKMFKNNFVTFEKYASKIRSLWYQNALRFYEEHQEFDLHLQMISTIAGAEDVYSGTKGIFNHKDEIWLWVPSTEQAIEHLKGFLSNFRMSPQVINNELEVEFLGKNAKELAQIFTESFLQIPQMISEDAKGDSLPIAILKFRAGTINSRKAMISPYLPRLIG